ncbi:hypothetical protein SNEBB_004863 [Seison nebaliae]|nr:hypothetical protein SNEBB_004863 [Seison nebaliae]
MSLHPSSRAMVSGAIDDVNVDQNEDRKLSYQEKMELISQVMKPSMTPVTPTFKMTCSDSDGLHQKDINSEESAFLQANAIPVRRKSINTLFNLASSNPSDNMPDMSSQFIKSNRAESHPTPVNVSIKITEHFDQKQQQQPSPTQQQQQQQHYHPQHQQQYHQQHQQPQQHHYNHEQQFKKERQKIYQQEIFYDDSSTNILLNEKEQQIISQNAIANRTITENINRSSISSMSTTTSSELLPVSDDITELKCIFGTAYSSKQSNTESCRTTSNHSSGSLTPHLLDMDDLNIEDDLYTSSSMMKCNSNPNISSINTIARKLLLFTGIDTGRPDCESSTTSHNSVISTKGRHQKERRSSNFLSPPKRQSRRKKLKNPKNTSTDLIESFHKDQLSFPLVNSNKRRHSALPQIILQEHEFIPKDGTKSLKNFGKTESFQSNSSSTSQCTESPSSVRSSRSSKLEHRVLQRLKKLQEEEEEKSSKIRPNSRSVKQSKPLFPSGKMPKSNENRDGSPSKRDKSEYRIIIKDGKKLRRRRKTREYQSEKLIEKGQRKSKKSSTGDDESRKCEKYKRKS